MSTSSYLAKFNVTFEQASQYVHANLHDLPGIVAVARQYGITSDMLGELAGGYSGAQVRGYLAGFGIETGSLEAESLFPSDMLQFSNVMALNTRGDDLSTASLRAQVIARTGATAYDAAFDPNQYAGGLDGVFSAADQGISSLGPLPATAETLESLFYGTIIRLAGSVDMQELLQVQSFAHDNAAGLASEDPAVTRALVTLMLGVVEDRPALPAFSDSMIGQVAVASAVALVGIASQHAHSLFDELLSGFVL